MEPDLAEHAFSNAFLFFAEVPVQPHRVLQPGQDELKAGDVVFIERLVGIGDKPYSAPYVGKGDVVVLGQMKGHCAGPGDRHIGGKHVQEGGLARAVSALQQPVLAPVELPGDVVQHRSAGKVDGGVFDRDKRLGILVLCSLCLRCLAAAAFCSEKCVRLLFLEGAGALAERAAAKVEPACYPGRDHGRPVRRHDNRADC